MLDQNTDRMWYVIGAVIIGAAIILIMNNTFPQLFASVGNTFKDKTEDVATDVEKLTVTDGVGPNDPNGKYAYGSLRIISVGFESANPVSGHFGKSNIYNSKGESMETDDGLRGLELFVFDKTDKLEFYQRYDTYSDSIATPNGTTQSMAQQLASITDPSKLVVVVMSDSVTWTSTDVRHMKNGLAEAMYNKGASKSVYGSLLHRTPYIFVGKAGLGEGNGYELKGAVGDVLDVTISVKNGVTDVLK